MNSNLPKSKVIAGEVLFCLEICENEPTCAGFTYFEKAETCEFQCSFQNELCSEPGFPANVEGQCCTVSRAGLCLLGSFIEASLLREPPLA